MDGLTTKTLLIENIVVVYSAILPGRKTGIISKEGANFGWQ